jgi:hypothetical protein
MMRVLPLLVAASLAWGADAFAPCPALPAAKRLHGVARARSHRAPPGSLWRKPLQLRMAQDEGEGPNEAEMSLGKLLALPTGEMFMSIGSMMMKPRLNIPTFFASTTVSSVLLAGFLIFSFFTASDIRILDTADNGSSKNILLFGEVLKDLEEGYVEKVDAEKLFQTAVEAMTASLDPYTEFESQKVSEDNQIRYNGRYGGVGMGIERDWTIDPQKGKKLRPDRFRVSSALEGYAWDVGMRGKLPMLIEVRV